MGSPKTIDFGTAQLQKIIDFILFDDSFILFIIFLYFFYTFLYFLYFYEGFGAVSSSRGLSGRGYPSSTRAFSDATTLSKGPVHRSR